MSTTYPGQAIHSTAIPLIDDSTPPKGSEINVSLEALRDEDVYLDQRLTQSFAKFSAKNFVNVAFQDVAGDGHYICNVTGLCASRAADGSRGQHFMLAVRSGVDTSKVFLAVTRDGFAFQTRQETTPLADSREYAGIALRDDGWRVLGMAGKLETSASQGTRIDVLAPGSNVVDKTPRSLPGNTNYKAACFLGSRAYALGCVTAVGPSVPGNSTQIAGATARIVSATEAGGFLDWHVPSGGTLTGGMASSSNWIVAQHSSSPLALANDPFGGASQYVLIDGAADTITQLDYPSAGSDLSSCNFVSWKGKFYCFMTVGSGGVGGVNVWSSADGVNWSQIAHVASKGVLSAVAEADCLVFFGGDDPALPLIGGNVAYVSFNGTTWDPLPVSGVGVCAAICSTTQRSMVLRGRTTDPLTQSNTLRVSLGGLT